MRRYNFLVIFFHRPGRLWWKIEASLIPKERPDGCSMSQTLVFSPLAGPITFFTAAYFDHETRFYTPSSLLSPLQILFPLMTNLSKKMYITKLDLHLSVCTLSLKPDSVPLGSVHPNQITSQLTQFNTVRGDTIAARRPNSERERDGHCLDVSKPSWGEHCMHGKKTEGLYAVTLGH